MPQLDATMIWLRPGQVAERAGVAVSALHYYERLGLIRSRRTSANRREYRRDTLRVIAFIRTAQRLGVPLRRVKEALDQFPEGQVATARDWARISRQWRDELTGRIEELTALRDRFADCIGCGCLSLTSCPYSNPDDVLGLQGAGARRFPDHGRTDCRPTLDVAGTCR
ncbi:MULTISPECIES: redox-sensitive transcriptional activator SoxR [Micromonospora]|uniref:MerR family transcriptional regulator, redox-sensitive transcriptional activator SoxR n=1 Tax=Micromonospora yangpuensis TaxID=683228 RepID=A0A1C6UPW8_9ACTN|nr:redox-sensitive transcriptional activator SoxR [Micromonospora yangpuensis]GGM08090.1 redox-sensitive transcriptional activator SoxR [Micromonospora yangpuensis]SCL56062.1 MerR family transcriptional regulator, redox-sensitive transcriptional activator SoxR [Micromonospora yangpuensis]